MRHKKGSDVIESFAIHFNLDCHVLAIARHDLALLRAHLCHVCFRALQQLLGHEFSLSSYYQIHNVCETEVTEKSGAYIDCAGRVFQGFLHDEKVFVTEYTIGSWHNTTVVYLTSIEYRRLAGFIAHGLQYFHFAKL